MPTTPPPIPPRSARRLTRATALARRIARRIADPIPITPLGVLATALFWGGLEQYAFAEMDMVLLVTCSVGLGVVALALTMTIIGAVVLRIRARRIVTREHCALETERATRTDFALPSLGWLPLVRVTWEVERPGGFDVTLGRRFLRREEILTAHERGEHQGVRRRVVVEDAFRLARIAFRLDHDTRLEVLPHPGGLRRMEPLAAFAGGDDMPHPMGLTEGDRVELRRYAPGDPARFIHWKIFGRTRKLVVRMPERALEEARRVAAFLVAGEDDDASAAAARVAVERGAFGREWVFSADGARNDADTATDALRLIIASARHRDLSGRALAEFVARAETEGPVAVVVFAPPHAGPWVERVRKVARRLPRGLRVVITVDGLSSAKRASSWRRILSRAPRRFGVSSDALDEVLRALGKERIDVVVLDRASGRRLGGGHRARVAASTSAQASKNGPKEQRAA